MVKPKGIGGETLLGVSEKGRGRSRPKPGRRHGAESTGPWAPGVCTRESARLMGRTPRPQAQTSRAVGQQRSQVLCTHRVWGSQLPSSGDRQGFRRAKREGLGWRRT